MIIIIISITIHDFFTMATKENLRMNFLAAHSKVAFSLSRCAIWNMKLMMMVILVVMMMTTEMINGDDDNVAHMNTLTSVQQAGSCDSGFWTIEK